MRPHRSSFQFRKGIHTTGHVRDVATFRLSGGAIRRLECIKVVIWLPTVAPGNRSTFPQVFNARERHYTERKLLLTDTQWFSRA